MKKHLLLILVTLTSVNMLFADQALNNAARDGKLDEVGRLLEQYKNDEGALKEYVNWQDRWGNTALIGAARKDHKEIAELLIAAKADLNIQNQDCRAALIVAIRYGNTDMAKLLIAAGADINSQDRWGGTALMMAALVGRTESVELLIKAGADLNIQDEYGDTALIKAVRYGKTAIVKLLIAAGADLNILDKKGETVWNLSTVTNFLGESHTLLTVTIQSCVEAHLDWLNIEDQALSSENIAQAVRELLFLEKRLLQSDNAQAWSRLEQRFGKRQIDNQLEDKYTQAELEMAKDIYPSVLNALLENVNQETHANDYSPLFTKDELEKLTGRED